LAHQPCSNNITLRATSVFISGALYHQGGRHTIDPGCERPELREFNKTRVNGCLLVANRRQSICGCAACWPAPTWSPGGHSSAPAGGLMKVGFNTVRSALNMAGQQEPGDSIETTRKEPGADYVRQHSRTACIANRWSDLTPDGQHEQGDAPRQANQQPRKATVSELARSDAMAAVAYQEVKNNSIRRPIAPTSWKWRRSIKLQKDRRWVGSPTRQARRRQSHRLRGLVYRARGASRQVHVTQAMCRACRFETRVYSG